MPATNTASSAIEPTTTVATASIRQPARGARRERTAAQDERTHERW
jgi:hypothetical protein